MSITTECGCEAVAGNYKVASAPARPTVTIHVDGISERPVLGGGCCAIPAMAAIMQALEEVPGIDAIEQNDGESRLLLHLSGDDPAAPGAVVGEAAEAIKSLGYRLRSVLISDPSGH